MLAPDSRHSTETGVPDLLGGALIAIGIGALTLAVPLRLPGQGRQEPETTG
ncbi:hypothetical protein [Streptomyces sp. NBC_01190]|uniref:hypothetical protein n=1 Tax=Streptomyces sp. NBC_01190 TaxID=2903767 RepID=UPI003865514E|nr:hypothetical protein OG519_01510 [Streptomyces sp. NBC_01190]